jgi:hypothetical protein
VPRRQRSYVADTDPSSNFVFSINVDQCCATFPFVPIESRRYFSVKVALCGSSTNTSSFRSRRAEPEESLRTEREPPTIELVKRPCWQNGKGRSIQNHIAVWDAYHLAEKVSASGYNSILHFQHRPMIISLYTYAVIQAVPVLAEVMPITLQRDEAARVTAARVDLILFNAILIFKALLYVFVWWLVGTGNFLFC